MEGPIEECKNDFPEASALSPSDSAKFLYALEGDMKKHQSSPFGTPSHVLAPAYFQEKDADILSEEDQMFLRQHWGPNMVWNNMPTLAIQTWIAQLRAAQEREGTKKKKNARAPEETDLRADSSVE